MKKKDRENEYIGIVSFAVIVALAVGLLYYFHTHNAARTPIPIEVSEPQK